ncbi:MAG: glycine/sarcosine/betaine reductase selenoprotein B family protein, partial [Candidatus Krumholzibacteriia bacterium]
MGEMSRRSIPYTPFGRDLGSTVVAIASATGVHLRSQEAFSTEDPGEISHRVVPGDADVGELVISHHHYDHTDADRDPNIVFPLATLQELVAEGVIAGVAEKHYTYGFTTRLRELYEETFPHIVREIERSKTDAVVLTAGCPGVCHRSIVHLQREIEMRAIATVAITVSPENTASMRPPRALHPEGFGLGRVLGPPGRRDVHRAVMLAALEHLSAG